MSFALSTAAPLRRISTVVILCTSTTLSACGMGDVRRPQTDVGNGSNVSVADNTIVVPPIAENPPVDQSMADSSLAGEEEQIATNDAVEPAAPEASQPVVTEESRSLTTQEQNYGYAVGISDPIARGQSNYGMPGSEIACRTQLKQLGVVFQERAPINDGGVCRIDNPLTVSGFASGNIRLKPSATLNCQMTLAFARWVKGDLSPSTRLRYLSGVNTIHQASSYSCRTMSNRRGANMSEHSKGNALDIAKITLNNGTDIKVQKPGFFAFRQRGLLNNVRSDACDYFTTVLGPGYDIFHKDHFHFDLMQRRSSHRACR
ncbi:extensin [Phyllobacterium sp. 628]|uniref:extensin-like domain-containing protein n=1 Tax=Phyllobacterium sp. 628 TaxID=2718938 RepID=UPI0016624C13|nr:extensin family protein [Phyllobacterium sp. 628]QND53773.1 extensin [Phyllobacterium sp. 628]